MSIHEIRGGDHRTPEHEVEAIFLDRWSPRSMSGEVIEEKELMRLFEAAKWAPSSYNLQPWRFLYARRDTEHWPAFFDLLVEFNQLWAKNAAALIVMLSRKITEKGDESITHSFDAGAAWENLALQGAAMELVVHGMQGFDYDKARTALNVPDEWQVEAMAVIGKPAKREDLHERMQKQETPSPRKPLSEIVQEGPFA